MIAAIFREAHPNNLVVAVSFPEDGILDLLGFLLACYKNQAVPIQKRSAPCSTLVTGWASADHFDSTAFTQKSALVPATVQYPFLHPAASHTTHGQNARFPC